MRRHGRLKERRNGAASRRQARRQARKARGGR